MHNFLGIYNLHFTLFRGHREPMGRESGKPLSGLKRESGGNERAAAPGSSHPAIAQREREEVHNDELCPPPS